ncbi:hypothetical protein C8J56DRAFT_1021112, partial [Mycena floridula]
MSRYYLDAAPVTATVDPASPFSLHCTSRATVLFGLVKGPGPDGKAASASIRFRHDPDITSDIVLGQDWLASARTELSSHLITPVAESGPSTSSPTILSYSSVLLDGIPVTAQNINMMSMSYHCRPHNRTIKSLVTGPDLYGTVFSTTLLFHPKPSTLPTTADILLGADWLRDCAIHAIHNGPSLPQAEPAPSNRHPDDQPSFATTAPQTPGVSQIHGFTLTPDKDKDKDKDKDNDKDTDYNVSEDVCNNDFVGETHDQLPESAGNSDNFVNEVNPDQTMDELLEDARNGAASDASCSSRNNAESPTPSAVFVVPPSRDDLPDIVYNPQATAEEQRHIARELFHDNLFKHKTTRAQCDGKMAQTGSQNWRGKRICCGIFGAGRSVSSG